VAREDEKKIIEHLDSWRINQLGSEPKMSESMQKEIDKRFLRGIAASPGIVIGKAQVFQDILLLVERQILEEGFYRAREPICYPVDCDECEARKECSES
jgi:phosphoenolpyruvate synthase/pyruvate phosphate dikinase